MATSSKLVKVARAEIGYLEKETNAYLNFKKKNAGDNNYTKYGKWYGANGVYWCAEFVSWCFYKAFGKKKGKELLCGGYSASCETLRGQFIDKGRFSKVPKVGDLIFFSGTRHSGANHIGIVVKITGDRVYTVEGNTSNANEVVDNGGCVALKSYTTSYTRIIGYGHPKYTVKPISIRAAKPTLKKGMNGPEVKMLQRDLNLVMKADLVIDGKYGELTAKINKKYKLRYNIGVDGDVYGKKAYKVMKKLL